MKEPVLSHRLSGLDAAFLYLERKEIPLHIASVSVFEEPIPFDEFVASIDSKLDLIPRYRQIAVAPPFNLSYPTWEFDPNFDIGRHIYRVHVDPPGGEAELEALAGRILSRTMDRSKPLWDIHVVHGLKHGQGALIARVHHALADGISGEALMKVMLDPTPEGSRAVKKSRFRRNHHPIPDYSMGSVIRSAVQSTVENIMSAELGLLDMARSLFDSRMQAGLQGLTTLLPELAAAVERLPFNRTCGCEHTFCWAEFSFGDLQAIRAAAGGKVNDVILTVLMRALARYVKMHGETVVNRYVRVVCPVSMRREDNGESLGNRISFLPVVLPMDIQDPIKMLHAVALRTEIMKSARAADMVRLLASWLGATPPAVQSMLWWGLPYITFPVPLFNIICTNVAGSPVPLYAAGKRMTASYPHVPTGYDLGVGVAAQSYDGKLFYGFTADTQAAPDAGRLRDFVIDSFAELCQAAGVKQSPRPSAPRPVPKVRAKASAKPRKKPKRHVKRAEPVADALAEAPRERTAEAARPAPKAKAQRQVKQAEPAPIIVPEAPPETTAPAPETAPASMVVSAGGNR